MRSPALVISALLTVVLFLAGCGSPAQVSSAPLDESQLESRVLDIIRKNPQVILESVQAYQSQQQQERTAKRNEVFAQLQEAPKLVIRDSPFTGSQAQSLVLAEFSDFQCPFCKAAHTAVKEFMAEYGGEVTLVYKFFPIAQIHPQAEPSAYAAWAAGQQGKFWQFYDGLFESQDRLGEELYRSLAQAQGLNMAKFDRDRRSAAAKAAVEKDLELGRSLGVTGTPSYVFNGRFFSGAPMPRI
ncbi:MAG: thioredoxin domain-containing protein [Oscillatoriales cyanobacterium SM2_2_1]|nr:thioredoxin domain-containing protein [Oscillatoriales cyanobacterium SM2_2_1]